VLIPTRIPFPNCPAPGSVSRFTRAGVVFQFIPFVVRDDNSFNVRDSRGRPRRGKLKGLSNPSRRKLHPSGSTLRLLSLAARVPNFRCGGARVAKLMRIYDQTLAHSFLRILDPKGGLAPGDPDRMGARIIESVNVEPAPLRLVLGSQAMEGTLTTRRKRVASFEAQSNSPLRRIFRTRRDIYGTFLPNTTTCRSK
jgi:hypothetical protein